MIFELAMGAAMIPPEGSLLERVLPLDLAVGPGVIGLS